mgnify:CR=1 FL=1
MIRNDKRPAKWKQHFAVSLELILDVNPALQFRQKSVPVSNGIQGGEKWTKSCTANPFDDCQF